MNRSEGGYPSRGRVTEAAVVTMNSVLSVECVVNFSLKLIEPFRVGQLVHPFVEMLLTETNLEVVLLNGDSSGLAAVVTLHI